MNTQEIMEKYLAENGYTSIEDWANDSDYYYDPEYGAWHDEMGNDVDIEACFYYALESSGYMNDLV